MPRAQDNYYYKNYDSTVSSTHDWRSVHICLPFMEKTLNAGKNLKILDVGCGPGSITFDVYENYGDSNTIIGIDTPVDLIKSCKSKYCSGNNTITNTTNGNALSFAQGSIYKLPFPDNEFDIVYCHQVLIHLEDPVAGLNEMKRVLNKNRGELYICEAEIRSLMIYPLIYQDTLSAYFKTQQSTFTKSSFGLSLIHLFEQTDVYHTSAIKEQLNFGVVPWCLSKDVDKQHFAAMYTDRIASRRDIPEVPQYIRAWHEWAYDSSSTFVMIQGYLSVVYSVQ